MKVRLRTADLSWRELDGEGVLLDLRQSKYLTVNPTGTTLLQLLAGECTSAELATALVAKYSISQAEAEEDVASFVAELDARGLLDV
jgi:hypothetical protein